MDYVILFLKVVFLLLVIVTIVGTTTYIERKVLALVQLRKGPNTVGWHGVLQPIADCFKLLNKQVLWPKLSDKFLFVLSPFITILFPLLAVCFLPILEPVGLIQNEYSLLIVLALSMFGSLGECIPGLIVDSTYQRYGAFRAIVQIVSYEICLGLCLLNVGLVAGGFSFEKVVFAQQNCWLCFLLPHVLIAYMIASFAECNRTPFDTLEAEQELIAGYHTEYSSVLFCVFYVSEYTNIFLASLLISILFLGGGQPIFGVDFVPWCVMLFGKAMAVMLFILGTRAVLPRYKFYKIITLFWVVIMPILLLSALGLIMLFANTTISL